MPTADRYALNELQQAVLDVLAGQFVLNTTGDAGEARPAVPRNEIIERVRVIPGLDDVTGMSLGPCLAALKRRGLVRHYAGDDWYITAQGLGYVDQEEGEEPSLGASATACDDQRGEAPDDVEPGVRLIRPLHPLPAAERLHEGSAEDRAEQARPDTDMWRGLDALLTIGDLRQHHSRELQLELRELLMGLGVRAVDAAMKLPSGDPRRDDLGELGKACRELSTTLKTTLIVPGHAPGEVAA